MKLLGFMRALFAVSLLLTSLNLAAAPAQFAELVRIIGPDSKQVVGAVKKETGESIEVVELKTGQSITFAKASIKHLTRKLADREAAQVAGSARLLAWKIQQVLPQNQIVGKVASLDQGTVYTTLNAKTGISKDEALNVYRVSKEIRDPDTGQVLDRERRKIAKLIVTEVGERVVKAKTADDLEIEIRVGDEVEPVKQSRAIAILPATDLAGNVRAAGKRFSEELTSSLTEMGVAVVERGQLDRVRGELATQQTADFDGDTARQLGKLVGAFAVLTGTIGDDWISTQNSLLRLVKVETGEILFGASLGSSVSSPSGGIRSPQASIPSPDSPSGRPMPLEQPAGRIRGQVVAWGSNKSGQCNVPAGLANVVAVAAGRGHSMALRADGTVVAWGDSSKGQSAVPPGLRDVIAIAAGYNHSVALRKDGSVVSWGENDQRQLITPPAIQGKVVAISAGSSFTIALTRAGTVVGWGASNVNQSKPPSGLSGVLKIASGAHHSLAMKQDGSVVAWGTGAHGISNIPGNVASPRSFAGGWEQTAVVLNDGSVSVWGYDGYGAVRKKPSGNIGAIQITAGESHVAALKNDGTVVVWGDNGQGELNVPTGLTSVARIASGAFHVVALK